MILNNNLSRDSIKVYDEVMTLPMLDRVTSAGRTLFEQGKFTQHKNIDVMTSQEIDSKARNSLVARLKDQPSYRNNILSLIENTFKDSLKQYLDEFTLDHGTDPTKILFAEKINTLTFFSYINYLFYKKGEGHYNSWHTDSYRLGEVTSYTQAKKLGGKIFHPELFSFIFYLSEDREVFTEFPYFNIKVPANVNRLLIFPSQWPYVHKGGLAKNTDKLVVAGVLRYDKTGKVAQIYNDYEYKGSYPTLYK